jgi:hypothetical protein
MSVPRRAPAWEAFRLLGGRWLPPVVQAATDLLLPPACNFCGRSLARPSSQPLICAECREAFIAKIGPSCPRCAAPVHPFEAGPDCPRCRKRRYAFHSALALGIYRDRLREAVIRMKQRLHEPLTISMGHLLAETMAEAVQQEQPDLLVASSHILAKATSSRRQRSGSACRGDWIDVIDSDGTPVVVLPTEHQEAGDAVAIRATAERPQRVWRKQELRFGRCARDVGRRHHDHRGDGQRGGTDTAPRRGESGHRLGGGSRRRTGPARGAALNGRPGIVRLHRRDYCEE